MGPSLKLMGGVESLCSALYAPVSSPTFPRRISRWKLICGPLSQRRSNQGISPLVPQLVQREGGVVV